MEMKVSNPHLRHKQGSWHTISVTEVFQFHSVTNSVAAALVWHAGMSSDIRTSLYGYRHVLAEMICRQVWFTSDQERISERCTARTRGRMLALVFEPNNGIDERQSNRV
eukprot:1422559-Amphidinium_carterae.1